MKATTTLGAYLVVSADEEGSFDRLAESIGVSRSALASLVECGPDHDPTLRTMELVALGLGLTLVEAVAYHRERIDDGPEHHADHGAGGRARMMRATPEERRALARIAEERRRVGDTSAQIALPGVTT